MDLVGKCPPESEELAKAFNRGFNRVELYIEKEHLDSFGETVELVEKAEADVVSVHTPHVSLDEKAYFLLAGRLASMFEAYLMFHSQYLHHTHVSELEKVPIDTDYGYENNPGASFRHLEAMILEEGHELVLDTAHFFMAHSDYLSKIRALFNSYGDSIGLIHLCDSTRKKDGLGFGKGTMDMEEIVSVISNSEYNGKVVLEVMPRNQKKARKDVMSYLK
jgi:sugar phosphate isomerase/epimerase